MKGVQFLVDEKGRARSVLIDLKENAELWEDFYDAAVARRREGVPHESLTLVGGRLRKLEKPGRRRG